jgi:hypothetical protein
MFNLEAKIILSEQDLFLVCNLFQKFQLGFRELIGIYIGKYIGNFTHGQFFQCQQNSIERRAESPTSIA